MTLPNEELRALKRTHEFMRDILAIPNRAHFSKMTKEEFEAWKREAYYCIKHYPFDFVLDELWEERINRSTQLLTNNKTETT